MRSELVTATATALKPRAKDEGGGGESSTKAGLSSEHQTASIMGLPFDRLDHGTLIELFLEGVRTQNGGWIVTPNLDILRQFTGNPESRELGIPFSLRLFGWAVACRLRGGH